METTQKTEWGRALSAAPRCPLCDGPAETTWRQHVFRYGAGKSAVDISSLLPVRQCTACEFEFLDHEGERLKHEALCRHFGVLTPREIRGIRQRHKMTRLEFAKITGLGEASLGRWESGTVMQTHGNDRYLRLLAQPGAIVRLTEVLLSISEAVHEQAGESSGPKQKRFRSLTITEETTVQKQAFQLRKAA